MGSRKQNSGRSTKLVPFHFEAFALWVGGMPMSQIAKKVGYDRATVTRWKKREKWDDGIEKIRKESAVKAVEDITEKNTELNTQALDTTRLAMTLASKVVVKLANNPDPLDAAGMNRLGQALKVHRDAYETARIAGGQHTSHAKMDVKQESWPEVMKAIESEED